MVWNGQGIGNGDYRMRWWGLQGAEHWISLGFLLVSRRLWFSHNQLELRYTRAIEANVGRMSGEELTGDW